MCSGRRKGGGLEKAGGCFFFVNELESSMLVVLQ